MNELAKKKKKGFTLIELIAVIAIIGILAAVLVPRIVGYMNDAKRSKIVTQSRTVVMTYEAYKAKSVTSHPETIDINTLKGLMTGALVDYADDLDENKLDMLDFANVTVEECRVAANGKDASGSAKTIQLGSGAKWDGTSN